MDNPVINDCKEQLLSEAAKLKEKEDALRGQLAEVKADVKRISSFIANLDREAGKRKLSKPSAKGSDVREIVLAILKKVPSIQKDKLFELLEGQVEKAGFNRMGLPLRFNEALSDSHVVVTTDGISLAKQEARARVQGVEAVEQGSPSR